MAKLADGVEFELGMTIYYPDLWEYEVREVNTGNPCRSGEDWRTIGDYIKGGGFSHEYIPHYFSTKKAALFILTSSIKKQVFRLSKIIIALENQYGEE